VFVFWSLSSVVKRRTLCPQNVMLSSFTLCKSPKIVPVFVLWEVNVKINWLSKTVGLLCEGLGCLASYSSELTCESTLHFRCLV